MAVILPVHHENGPQGARPETADRLEGVFEVGRRVAFLDAQEIRDVARDQFGAPDVTRRPHAEAELVAPLGLQAERLVERHHLVDAADRHAEVGAHRKQGVLRKVVELPLDVLEDGNQVTLVPAVSLNDFLNLFFHSLFTSSSMVWSRVTGSAGP